VLRRCVSLRLYGLLLVLHVDREVVLDVEMPIGLRTELLNVLEDALW